MRYVRTVEANNIQIIIVSMTKLELLNLKLDCGEVVIFQSPLTYQYIAIGGTGKDDCDNYRTSGFQPTKKDTKRMIGEYFGFSQGELEKYIKEWKYIDSYVHAYGKAVPVGTKVVIKDKIREIYLKGIVSYYPYMEEEISNMEDLVGETLYVSGKEDKYYLKNNNVFWKFPREMFVIAWDEETENEDYKVVKAMREYGDSFIKSLALTFHNADPANFRKLKTTFSEYWEEYKKMV